MPEKSAPHGLTPHLTLPNAAAAIEFYRAAFNAEEHHRYLAPNSAPGAAPNTGRILHAALSIHGSYVMLSDDFPEFAGGHSRTPEALGGCPITLHLQVENADAAFAQALAAGATATMPLADQFWGDRYGQLRDPFGYTWAIGHTLRTLSADEMQRNMEKAFNR